MWVRVAVALLMLLPTAVHAQTEKRIALLIGNQSYGANIGRLRNPHADTALIGAALSSLGFSVAEVKDASYKAIDTAIKRHIQTVRREGKGTISFVYYSGHGAADPDTKINYLIPVDVTSADDDNLWINSVNLNNIIENLREQAPLATHYVVFDACRNELNLTRKGQKALSDKGFVPLSFTPGVMIAYATAPGRTASDTGSEGGPYARALSDEIVKPGAEALYMFRRVALRVNREIGQDPWISASTLPEVYFAGKKPEGPTPEQQLEMAFWASVKDNTDPAVLKTYLDRYPSGAFATAAAALIDQQSQRIKAEAAASEERHKRAEEARKAAELRRIEDENKARELALEAERRRAEEKKDLAAAKRIDEQLQARTDELRQALDEVRVARDAARVAEEQRLVAMKKADEATKAAEEALAVKHDAVKATEPAKMAALPKQEKELPKIQQPTGNPFDGIWNMVRHGTDCGSANTYRATLIIKNGVVSGEMGAGGVRGSVTPSGTFHLTHLSITGGQGAIQRHSGRLQGSRGSGTFAHSTNSCKGTFTMVRR